MSFFSTRGSRLALLAVLSLSIAACGSNRNKRSSANRVVEHHLSDMERLNPFNSTGANETYVEEQIFERLIRINPITMEYDIPWIAESLPVESEDKMQYDFTIRKDLKWADGRPLTGEDVVFSLKALKNPLNTMSGQKRVYVDPLHSAELIDGDKYRVRFKLWKPYFLVKQAAFGDVLYILPKHMFDPKGLTDKYSWDDIARMVEHGENDKVNIDVKSLPAAMGEFAEWFTGNDLGRSPEYLRGSGPYKLDTWVTNDFIRLIRNTMYVEKHPEFGKAYPDTLIYKTINDNNSAITALKSRTLDLMGFVQPALYVQLDTVKSPGISKTAFDLPAFALLGFNQKNPIFADPKVRWAMAYLVDKKTIIDKVLHGLAVPTQSPVFYGRKEYLELPPIPFDPARAQAILDSIDWKDHDGDGIRDKMINGKRIPFEFSFTVNSGNETRKAILLVVAEQMRKAGIKAEVQTIEWSVFLDRMRDHNFDARYGSWQQDPYESDNYQLYHSSQAKNRGSNYDNFMSPKADRLLDLIRNERDEATRIQYQKEFQQVLYDEQANLILWVPKNPTAWVNRFDNVSFNAVRPGYDIAWWKVRGAGPSAKDMPE